jgi:hypothetical protein
VHNSVSRREWEQITYDGRNGGTGLAEITDDNSVVDELAGRRRQEKQLSEYRLLRQETDVSNVVSLVIATYID